MSASLNFPSKAKPKNYYMAAQELIIPTKRETSLHTIEAGCLAQELITPTKRETLLYTIEADCLAQELITPRAYT